MAICVLFRALMPGVLQFGFLYQVVEYDVYLGEILVAEAALVVFGLLSIYAKRLVKHIQTVLALVVVLGVALLLIAASTKTDLTQVAPPFGYDDPHAYQGVLTIVLLAPHITSVSALSPESYLLLAIWCVLGYVFYWRSLRMSVMQSGERPIGAGVILFFLIFFSSAMWFLETVLRIDDPKQMQAAEQPSEPEAADAEPQAVDFGAIRALGDERSRVPIVAMTANAFSEDIKNARAAGMNAHIAKPIDVAMMLQTLGEVLSGK